MVSRLQAVEEESRGTSQNEVVVEDCQSHAHTSNHHVLSQLAASGEGKVVSQFNSELEIHQSIHGVDPEEPVWPVVLVEQGRPVSKDDDPVSSLDKAFVVAPVNANDGP